MTTTAINSVTEFGYEDAEQALIAATVLSADDAKRTLEVGAFAEALCISVMEGDEEVRGATHLGREGAIGLRDLLNAWLEETA